LSPIYINPMFTIYLIKIVWVRACFVWARKLNIAGLPKVQGNSFTSTVRLHQSFGVKLQKIMLCLCHIKTQNETKLTKV